VFPAGPFRELNAGTARPGTLRGMTSFPPPPPPPPPVRPPSNNGRSLLTVGGILLVLGLSGVWKIERDPEPAASVGYLVVTPLLGAGGVLLLLGGVTWFVRRRSGRETG
jgi:hypothetical protein